MICPLPAGQQERSALLLGRKIEVEEGHELPEARAFVVLALLHGQVARWILEGERTRIGCGVHHAFWKKRGPEGVRLGRDIRGG